LPLPTRPRVNSSQQRKTSKKQSRKRRIAPLQPSQVALKATGKSSNILKESKNNVKNSNLISVCMEDLANGIGGYSGRLKLGSKEPLQGELQSKLGKSVTRQ
jgi:hypothetical protein